MSNTPPMTSHLLPELEAEDWVQPHPGAAAEESAQNRDTAEEDDSDTDLTYGEVEQRLDLLQQHLNRWERGLSVLLSEIRIFT